MNSAIDQIKQLLSMRQVAEKYGFAVNQSGFIACPFHAEHTPSLKIYAEIGRGFSCFGCQTSGDVIDFVMKLLHIPLNQAIMQLNSDFGLHIVNGKPDRRQMERMHKERHAQRKAERDRLAMIQALAEDHCRLWWEIKTEPIMSDKWCDAMIKIEFINYRLEVMECQT